MAERNNQEKVNPRDRSILRSWSCPPPLTRSIPVVAQGGQELFDFMESEPISDLAQMPTSARYSSATHIPANTGSFQQVAQNVEDLTVWAEMLESPLDLRVTRIPANSGNDNEIDQSGNVRFDEEPLSDLQHMQLTALDLRVNSNAGNDYEVPQELFDFVESEPIYDLAQMPTSALYSSATHIPANVGSYHQVDQGGKELFDFVESGPIYDLAQMPTSALYSRATDIPANSGSYHQVAPGGKELFDFMESEPISDLAQMPTSARYSSATHIPANAGSYHQVAQGGKELFDFVASEPFFDVAQMPTSDLNSNAGSYHQDSQGGKPSDLVEIPDSAFDFWDTNIPANAGYDNKVAQEEDFFTDSSETCTSLSGTSSPANAGKYRDFIADSSIMPETFTSLSTNSPTHAGNYRDFFADSSRKPKTYTSLSTISPANAGKYRDFFTDSSIMPETYTSLSTNSPAYAGKYQQVAQEEDFFTDSSETYTSSSTISPANAGNYQDYFTDSYRMPETCTSLLDTNSPSNAGNLQQASHTNTIEQFPQEAMRNMLPSFVTSFVVPDERRFWEALQENQVTENEEQEDLDKMIGTMNEKYFEEP